VSSLGLIKVRETPSQFTCARSSSEQWLYNASWRSCVDT